MITNANVAMVTSKPNSTLTFATSEDQADQNMQCGSDTPAKYTIGNLLKTGNGNHEEQQHTHVGMHTLHMYMCTNLIMVIFTHNTIFLPIEMYCTVV